MYQCSFTGLYCYMFNHVNKFKKENNNNNSIYELFDRTFCKLSPDCIGDN